MTHQPSRQRKNGSYHTSESGSADTLITIINYSKFKKMLQIIKERETKTEYAYRRIFRSDYECFGFQCDDDGNPIFKSVRDKKQFYKCFDNPNRYEDCGRVRREYTHISPAIARCECGATLKLLKLFRSPGIQCRCGRLYDEEGLENSWDQSQCQ